MHASQVILAPILSEKSYAGTTRGSYTFKVQNVGTIPHDLTIEGPNVTGGKKTTLITPGGTATLTVTLDTGSYTLYCSVPGHRAAGMSATLAVG